MSERGSFTTEYLYCDKCFEITKKVLLSNHKYLCSTTVPGWGERKELPIIAGKIGGLAPQEEIDQFESYLIPELEKSICHPMRIAVLAEEGQKILLAVPKAEHFDYLGEIEPENISYNQMLERRFSNSRYLLEDKDEQIRNLKQQLGSKDSIEPYYIDRVAELENVIRGLLGEIASLRRSHVKQD